MHEKRVTRAFSFIIKRKNGTLGKGIRSVPRRLTVLHDSILIHNLR